MQDRMGDKARLLHIRDAILEINNYIGTVPFDFFLDNSMMRFACVKQLEIIGEASNHLSIGLQNRFSEIEWAQIVGMRNVFVHEYFGIDNRLVWEIIKNDLPVLEEKILVILEVYQTD